MSTILDLYGRLSKNERFDLFLLMFISCAVFDVAVGIVFHQRMGDLMAQILIFFGNIVIAVGVSIVYFLHKTLE